MLWENLIYIPIIIGFGLMGITMVIVVVYYAIQILVKMMKGTLNQGVVIPTEQPKPTVSLGAYKNNCSYTPIKLSSCEELKRRVQESSVVHTNQDPIRQLSKMTRYGNAIKGPSISEKDIRMAIKNLANMK